MVCTLYDWPVPVAFSDDGCSWPELTKRMFVLGSSISPGEDAACRANLDGFCGLD
jgi:hypothetical protein